LLPFRKWDFQKALCCARFLLQEVFVIPTAFRQAQQVGNFFTIGYEQSELALFIKLLRDRDVDIVVDVREIPLSRKPGFSKHQLSAALEKAGIDYRHVVALGAPKKLRERLRQGGSWFQYIKGYNLVLEKQTEAIDELVALAATRRICLLCFERNASECHRSLIAREMEIRSNGLKLKVDHISY
jgi:uncharacterized protein (DUF488 family)